MIVIECDQGSPEWHAARVGVITASEFITARGIYKSGKEIGQPNAAAKAYAFKKAIERIGGKLLDDGFENWGMRRGHEMEPAARAEHEIQLGEVVHRCGFVKTDCGRFGGSLDGMIGTKGGSEYKAFASPEKLRGILIDGDLSEVMDQIQGGMWVADLEWLDFCLYCPELASAGNTLWHRRVARDDKYIGELVRDLHRFDMLVCDYMDAIRKSMRPADDFDAETRRQAAAALAAAAAPAAATAQAQAPQPPSIDADAARALLAHIDAAFDCKFPSHPKPTPAWWAALRDNAGRLRALLGDELQAA